MDKEIDHILFDCPSRHEIAESIAVVEIRNPMTNVVFEKNNSLHDTRLGAFWNVECGTCKQFGAKCLGHHGYIKLAAPCINPIFLETTMKLALTSFCLKCFKVASSCHCDSGVPSKIHLSTIHARNASFHQKGLKFKFEWKTNQVPVTISELHNLLAKIPRSEYIQVFPHFTRYQDITDGMFIHNLIVLPTIARRPNLSKGEWRPDPLTRLYVMILKNNLRLHIKAQDPKLADEYHADLQNSIDVLFNVNNTNSNLRSHVLTNGGIRQRIDGKEGRLRQNLMGKRVEFSARTVLSGDPQLGINEVGIPESVAQNLTIPMRINHYNMHTLKSYKIKYLLKKGDSNQRYDMNIVPLNSVLLEVGDVVERCLCNGDVVAVNRQPTLHRGSIIACSIRIFPCQTFRLNYSTMITLNADSDGDEINIHVPQDLESRAELEELMLASTNIVSSQASKPLIGLTQDSLLGCFLLSKEILSEVDTMSIVYAMGLTLEDRELEEDFCSCCDSKKMFPGNFILEKALRAVDVHLYRYSANEDTFLIQNNKVIFGVMNKSIVGTADNSVIHHIYLRKGHKAAAKFIHMMQRAATAFLDIHGFSIGVSDCIVSNSLPIHYDALDTVLAQQQDRWTTRQEGELCDALSELTKLKAPAGCSAENNSLLAAIESGSKGTVSNFNQITRVVGIQIEEEGRISERFKNRTLPHFTAFDNRIESKGFVKSSFIKGLKPHEFFFHAMGGRIGIIDTSCKTSVTGAQYRRMVKTLEPLIIRDSTGDSRIRSVMNTSTNQVIQFEYGEDGLDGTWLKKKKRRLTKTITNI